MKNNLLHNVKKMEHMRSILKFLLILLFFNLNANLNAQSTIEDDTGTILEFNEAVNLPENSNHSNSLNTLCMEIVPTIFIKNNVLEFTTPSKSALRIVTDVASIKKLYENNTSYKSVEVIIIQINDFNEFNKMEILSALSSLPNLEYIYFSCSFELCNNVTNEIDCEKLKIGTKIKGDLFPLIVYSSEQSK